MIKTKLFSWFLNEMDSSAPKIDAQINAFVEREQVEIVDVKFAVEDDDILSMRALLLYKEKQKV